MFEVLFSNTIRKYQEDKIMQNQDITTESKKAYYDSINPKYITWDFYSKYINIEPNFGQLGLIVYLRTYSRFVPELNRREKWCETILRVVEYSLNLEDSHNESLRSFEQKQKEAQELFECLFYHKGYVAGRTYWIGGTKAVEFDSSSNYNCSACKIDSISSFAEGFVWLLLGAGFGYSVENKHITKLPKLPKLDKTIRHINDFSYDGFENTRFNLDQVTKEDLSLNDTEFANKFSIYSNHIQIKVGDSKYGWATAFRFLLHCLYSPNVKEIVLDYSSIRKEGERLKTFGGRSSGYKPLQEHFERVVKIFQDCHTTKLRSIDCLDILNSMGLAVVVSGIRRSSEICLFDAEDDLLLHAKDNLWLDDSLADKRDTRVMSNNSIALYDNPGFNYFNKVMESVKTSSEPGLFVLGNANKRAGRDSITNPCGEILLNEEGGVCNLVELNLLPHVKNGKLDMSSVYNALSLITRHSSRITLPNLWHTRWDKVQKEERLLGVSITGLMDTYDKLNWTNEDLSNFYKDVYTFTRDVADLYHIELEIPKSLLVTTTKPTGTISSLQSVSNGIHRHYAPYYIRRVRVSKSDPIAQALIDMGLLVCPENGQGNNINDEKCNTLVFTLVCKSEAKMRAIDESAIEQLERYKLGMQTWCEHNISNTISIDSLYKLKPLESIKLALQNWTKNNNFWNNLNGYSDEWIEVSKWLTRNFENFVGVSFIPKFDPEVAIYPQLPFEPINEEKYQDLKSKIPNLKEEEFIKLISKYESEFEEFELEASCNAGFCPSR